LAPSQENPCLTDDPDTTAKADAPGRNSRSLAAAQHLAAELAGRFLAERHSLPGGADPHRTHSVRNSRKEIVLRRKGVKALFRLAEREFFVAQEVVKNTQAGQ
jgi:hypothetical protein